jgi:predicted transcriptional regulator
MKKRGRLEIIKDILEVIRSKSGTIKPTHILYKSNLSHQMMQDYLAELIQKGFIQEGRSSQGKRYAITPKGLTYLQKYNSIVDFTESFGLGS